MSGTQFGDHFGPLRPTFVEEPSAVLAAAPTSKSEQQLPAGGAVEVVAPASWSDDAVAAAAELLGRPGEELRVGGVLAAIAKQIATWADDDGYFGNDTAAAAGFEGDLGAVNFLMGRLGERLTVAIGSTDDGQPPLLAQITGTLTASAPRARGRGV